MRNYYKTNSHYLTYTSSLKNVGRMYFLSLGVKGLIGTIFKVWVPMITNWQKWTDHMVDKMMKWENLQNILERSGICWYSHLIQEAELDLSWKLDLLDYKGHTPSLATNSNLYTPGKKDLKKGSDTVKPDILDGRFISLQLSFQWKFTVAHKIKIQLESFSANLHSHLVIFWHSKSSFPSEHLEWVSSDGCLTAKLVSATLQRSFGVQWQCGFLQYTDGANKCTGNNIDNVSLQGLTKIQILACPLGNLHFSSTCWSYFELAQSSVNIQASHENCQPCKWPRKSACLTGKFASPILSDTVFVQHCSCTCPITGTRQVCPSGDSDCPGVEGEMPPEVDRLVKSEKFSLLLWHSPGNQKHYIIRFLRMWT